MTRRPDVWHPNPEGGGWGHDWANAARCSDCREHPSPFAKFERLAQALVAVPKRRKRGRKRPS